MIQVLTNTSPKYLEVNLSQTSTQYFQQIDHLNLIDSYRTNDIDKSFNSKAKSSLCRNFMAKGLCPYGNKCQFAHGTEELRCNTDQQMAYKTRYCHSYLNKDFCEYGSRCNFMHKDDRQEVELTLKLRDIVYSERGHGKSRLLELVEKSEIDYN